MKDSITKKKKKKKCILYFIERPRPILYFTERPRCPSLCSDTHVEKTLYLGFHFLYLVSPANCLYFLLSSFFRSCFSVILRWKVAYWSAQMKGRLIRNTGSLSISRVCSFTPSKRTGSWPTVWIKRWTNTAFICILSPRYHLVKSTCLLNPNVGADSMTLHPSNQVDCV